MNYDVAIVGGGLAGNTLARQLIQLLPDLRIAVMERQEETGLKVGESTVEIAGNYLSRRLGLQGYLDEHHLPKNGLRFFFDSQDADLELHHLSEIGSDGFPQHPSFQVDRARLDTDLRRLNRSSGIEVLNGVRVKDIEIGGGGQSHRFTISRGAESARCTARWLVDASGRARVLQKSLGMRKVAVGHPLAAAWGRFENVADIDSAGPQSWRDRVRNTTRRLSTNHFCYPGYWIWLIPLRNNITSVGVVCRDELFTQSMSQAPGFFDFLCRHRALASLLTNAEPVDFRRCSGIAYATERFFGENRWGMTGEAAAFTDPLYSPGSDFIALENDFLTDLIVRDYAGETDQAVAERSLLYNRFMQFRFEATMLLYRDLYDVLGSCSLFRLKWKLDVSSYYNLWLHDYLLDRHLDAAFLEQQLARRSFVLNALASFSDAFQAVAEVLRHNGKYFAENSDQFQLGLDHMTCAGEVGKPRLPQQILCQTSELLGVVRDGLLTQLGGREKEKESRLVLADFHVRRPVI